MELLLSADILEFPYFHQEVEEVAQFHHLLMEPGTVRALNETRYGCGQKRGKQSKKWLC